MDNLNLNHNKIKQPFTDQSSINQSSTISSQFKQALISQSQVIPQIKDPINIQPIGERVLITPIQKESKTSGGIYIPSAAKEQRKEGIVVAVGTTKNKEPLPLSIKDHIIYTGFSAEEFTHQNKNYIMLDFKDIIAKVNK